ncbi:DUF3892 domain-containing protein [Deltaproteobacteria bacterium TL4]
MSVKNTLKRYLKGMVRNHSSKTLWVVETDTGNPIAHKLGSKRKSPKHIDADGFKRFDKKLIDGHSYWWKIYSFSTADIFDWGEGLLTIGIKVKKDDDEFNIKDEKTGETVPGGEVDYNHSNGWGDPIIYIIGAKRGKSGRLEEFLVEKRGWVSKSQAIALVEQGEIDNAVVVRPKQGEPYLRSRPDRRKADNFSQMANL